MSKPDQKMPKNICLFWLRATRQHSTLSNNTRAVSEQLRSNFRETGLCNRKRRNVTGKKRNVANLGCWTQFLGNDTGAVSEQFRSNFREIRLCNRKRWKRRGKKEKCCELGLLNPTRSCSFMWQTGNATQCLDAGAKKKKRKKRNVFATHYLFVSFFFH